MASTNHALFIVSAVGLVVLTAVSCPTLSAEHPLSQLSSLDMLVEEATEEPALFSVAPLALPEIRRVSTHPTDLTEKKKVVRNVIHHPRLRTQVKSVVSKPLVSDDMNQVALMKHSLENGREEMQKIQQSLRSMSEKLSQANSHNAELQEKLNQSQLTQTTLEEKTAAMIKDNENNNHNVAVQLAKYEHAEQQFNQDKTQDAKTIASLEQQITQLSEYQSAGRASQTALQEKLKASTARVAEVEALLSKVQQQLDEKSQQLNAQKTASTLSPSPHSEAEIRDYALGAYWAQEMMGMMKQKAQSGYHIGQQQVLSGAADMFNNKLKLPYQQLASVLKKLYAESDSNNQGRAQSSDTEKNYLSAFRKYPGVKHAKLGFDYLIIEPGEGKISKRDTASIVVRESLPDGEVISDMLSQGTVLTLQFAKFPPLFQGSLALLGNGGEIRIVVPPELAYGEKGRPPKVPPNETMVYDIKVVNIQKG